MLFHSIVKLFKDGNVCVCGLRGKGKDVLFGNVIARRDSPYVSNMNYGGEHHLLDFDKLNCGKNTYDDFINNTIKHYEYPYPEGSDIYLSDAGIYLPAQYTNELNKKYPYLPTYAALSRQISHNNFHFNAQNLNRVWDKFREQSATYIMCRQCFVIFGFVIQFITIYDKYDSAVNRVKPCRVTVPIFNKEAKIHAKIYRDDFFNKHGKVENHILIYRHKSEHDSFYFEKLLKEGVKNEK